MGAMSHQRAAITMSTEEVEAYLRQGGTAVLVTLGPDGYPDPVGMWYVVDDEGTVWMRSYAASQKVINLARDPRASVLVEDGARYAELRGVQLTGRMELVDDVERICDVFAGLMVKYEGVDPEHVDAVRTAYRERAPKQRVLRLDVTRVVSWDHAKQAAASGGTE
jgi:PPOX class probable F420-dependent enzyme